MPRPTAEPIAARTKPALLPQWPPVISNGLVVLLFILIGLTALYAIARWALRANHSEALVALFSFVITSLGMLTIIGNFFRGPSMALILPF